MNPNFTLPNVEQKVAKMPRKLKNQLITIVCLVFVFLIVFITIRDEAKNNITPAKAEVDYEAIEQELKLEQEKLEKEAQKNKLKQERNALDKKINEL